MNALSLTSIAALLLSGCALGYDFTVQAADDSGGDDVGDVALDADASGDIVEDADTVEPDTDDTSVDPDADTDLDTVDEPDTEADATDTTDEEVDVGPVDPPSEALLVSVLVHETAGLERTDEVVTFGFPVPEGLGISDINALHVYDANGRERPAQVKVLSRWNGRTSDRSAPLRWVLIDAIVDATASGETQLWVTDSGTGWDPEHRISVDAASSDVLTVSTGVIDVAVPRHYGGLISRVTDSETDAVIAEDASVDHYQTGMVLTVGGTDEVYRSSNDESPAVVIQEGGVIRTVVEVRTRLRGGLGGETLSDVELEAELTFLSGTPWVGVQLALANNARGWDAGWTPEGGNAVLVGALETRFPAQVVEGQLFDDGLGTPIATTDIVDWATQQVFDGGTGFAYTTLQNDLPERNGARHSGWLEVGDDAAGVALAVEAFAEESPQQMTVTADSIRVEHVPVTAGGPLGPGRTVIRRFWLGYGPTADDGMRIEHALHRLVAHVDPAYVAETRALGWPFDGDGPTGWSEDARAQQARERHEAIVATLAADEAPWDLGTLPDLADARYRPGAEQGDWYGFPMWGDFPAETGVNSHHDDMAWVLQQSFLRTGDPDLLRWATAKVRHHAGWGRYGGVSPVNGVAVAFPWPLGSEPMGLPAQVGPGAVEIRSLAWHYWMSGDPQVYDALTQTVAAVVRLQQSGMLDADELPDALDVLLDGYAVVGEVSWMNAAHTVASEIVDELELYDEDSPLDRDWVGRAFRALTHYRWVEPAGVDVVPEGMAAPTIPSLDPFAPAVPWLGSAAVYDADACETGFLADTALSAYAAAFIAVTAPDDVGARTVADRLYTDAVFYPMLSECLGAANPTLITERSGTVPEAWTLVGTGGDDLRRAAMLLGGWELYLGVIASQQTEEAP